MRFCPNSNNMVVVYNQANITQWIQEQATLTQSISIRQSVLATYQAQASSLETRLSFIRSNIRSTECQIDYERDQQKAEAHHHHDHHHRHSHQSGLGGLFSTIAHVATDISLQSRLSAYGMALGFSLLQVQIACGVGFGVAAVGGVATGSYGIHRFSTGMRQGLSKELNQIGNEAAQSYAHAS